jgi:NADH dehydrogenase
MAIIGKNKAVVDIPKKLHFNGFFAWLIWLFIHLISLITYRNRVQTFFNWMTSFLSRSIAANDNQTRKQEKKQQYSTK